MQIGTKIQAIMKEKKLINRNLSRTNAELEFETGRLKDL